MTGYVEIGGNLMHETERAYLVFDGSIEVWLPKSQVKLEQEISVNERGTFYVPEWLAIEKELI